MKKFTKKSRKSKKLLFATTVLLFGVTLCFTGAANVQAKSAISKNSITMYTHTTKQLKMKNAKSKVKWSSSNKQLVRFTNKRGKYRQTVTLKSGMKPGQCTITAKIKNKTYLCHVTVKDSKELFQFTVTDVQNKMGLPWDASEKALNGWPGEVYGYLNVTVKYVNDSSVAMPISKAYRKVEKLENGKWIDISPDIKVEYTMEGHICLPKSTLLWTYHVYYRKEDAAHFTSGTYRLKRSGTHETIPYISFTLE